METDAEKALDLLIHDLRAPLSVAQGYLRLLQEGRLPSDDERNRALAQTMDALGRIARLCADASAFSAPPEIESVASAVESTQAFVDRVRRACGTGPVTVAFEVEDEELSGAIRAQRLDRVAEAVATILLAASRTPRDAAARVHVSGTGDARFLFGVEAEWGRLAADPPQTIDPWRGGHGLALPLACRTVQSAGGRIWTVESARGAIGVSLPQE